MKRGTLKKKSPQSMTRAERRKVQYDANPEKYRKAARDWFLKNRDRALETNRKWRQSMKLSIFSHYSSGTMSCKCCGEKTLEFLTLDHINNNGTKLRKTYANGGHQHYRKIIKEKFPEGFQILCYNCNCGRAKTKDKKCPHEKVST